MKKELLLLILGALFSLFLFKFDLQNGFEYLGIKIQTSIFDFAKISSLDNFVTTQIIGYIFFILYLFSMKKYTKKNNSMSFGVLIIALIIGIYFEGTAIFECLNGNFVGKHLRFGNSLSILSFIIYYSVKKQIK